MLFLHFLEQNGFQVDVFNVHEILALFCSNSLVFVTFQAHVAIKTF